MVTQIPTTHLVRRLFPLAIKNLSNLALLILSAAFALPCVLRAQLNVHPEYMFLNEGSLSQECIVRNPSDDRIETWVTFRFGYPIMDDSGKVQMVYKDSADEGPESATRWLKAFPQRFTLDPEGVQIVRLLASPPPNLPDGEYYARVVVTEKFSRPLTPAEKRQGVAGQINMYSGSDVPIHYRKGRAFTGLTVQNPAVVVGTNSLMLSADLTRTGNASYWGKVRVQILDKADKIVGSAEHNLAIYAPMKFKMPMDILSLARGTYTLNMTFTTHRSDVSAKYLLSAPDQVQKLEFSVP
jgi:hypothetical protein